MAPLQENLQEKIDELEKKGYTASTYKVIDNYLVFHRDMNNAFDATLIDTTKTDQPHLYNRPIGDIDLREYASLEEAYDVICEQQQRLETPSGLANISYHIVAGIIVGSLLAAAVIYGSMNRKSSELPSIEERPVASYLERLTHHIH